MSNERRYTATLLLLARDRVRAASRAKYPVRLAADTLEPKFSVAIRAAFAVARKKVPNEKAVINTLEAALKKVLPELLRKAVVTGGTVASATLKAAGDLRAAASSSAKLKFSFNKENPRVAEWAEEHAAELVTDILETTRERLRLVVSSHAEGEIDDSEYADALSDAIGDAERAETIARTESMTAVHQGQREAWSQAIDDGLLPEDVKRVWIVTDDDKLCPICAPLDGETAGIDENFVEDIDGPPAHPNCRCTEGLL